MLFSRVCREGDIAKIDIPVERGIVKPAELPVSVPALISALLVAATQVTSAQSLSLVASPYNTAEKKANWSLLRTAAAKEVGVYDYAVHFFLKKLFCSTAVEDSLIAVL